MCAVVIELELDRLVEGCMIDRTESRSRLDQTIRTFEAHQPFCTVFHWVSYSAILTRTQPLNSIQLGITYSNFHTPTHKYASVLNPT